MGYKKNIECTPAQLKALYEICNDIDAMIGCGERDNVIQKRLLLIDRMLKNNGLKR